MNSQSLTFLWTPWSVALSVAAVLLAVVLCAMAWRRSGYSRAQGLLELFRLFMVALMALSLNQPEWVEEYRPLERPTVVVLWDNSTSMDTRRAAGVHAGRVSKDDDPSARRVDDIPPPIPAG